MNKRDHGTFTKITEFFIDYWSELLTIFLAIVTSVAEVVSTSAVGSISAFAAVVSIISISLITIKHRLNKMQDSMNHMNSSADIYFSKHIDLEELNRSLDKATQINILGVSLRDSIAAYYATLEQRVKNGAKVKVLIMGTDDDALRIASSRSDGEDTSMLIANYNYCLRKLELLKDAAAQDGSVEIRQINYPPNFAILLTHKGKSESQALIKFYSHKDPLDGASPIFWVYPWREKWWYSYFENQFDTLWISSSPLQ